MSMWMWRRGALSMALLGLAGCQAIQTAAVRPVASPVVLASAGPTAAPTPRPEATPSAAVTPPPAQPDYLPDQLIVALAPGLDAAAFMARPALAGFAVVRTMPLGGRDVVTLKVPAGTSLEAARVKVGNQPGVQRVVLDTLAKAFLSPNDPEANRQWGNKPGVADMEGAWDQLGGVDQSKVIAAIVDSGLDVLHEEWADTPSRIVAPQDMNTDSSDVSDDLGHGTLVTGLLGAPGNNSKGIAGVAWGIGLMPLKADLLVNGNYDYPMSNLLAAIKYAIDHNEGKADGDPKVRVINLSLGRLSGGTEPLYLEIFRYAREKGILVVAAAGNEGTSVIASPARTPGVVAVGSTSNHLALEFLSPFSNYGDRLDLVAPGGGVRVTLPSGANFIGDRVDPPVTNYGYASGTSEAAPFVSGVAALVFAKYDPANNSLRAGAGVNEAADMVDRVRAHLLRSVDDLGVPGWDPKFGAGRLNGRKALSAVGPLPAP